MQLVIKHLRFMKLIDVKEGQKAIIKKIDLEKKLKLKLIALGLNESCQVQVVKNDKRGSMILSCRNSKIILGRDVAQRIDVEKV